jgi:hypothetical protein
MGSASGLIGWSFRRASPASKSKLRPMLPPKISRESGKDQSYDFNLSNKISSSGGVNSISVPEWVFEHRIFGSRIQDRLPNNERPIRLPDIQLAVFHGLPKTGKCEEAR